MKTFLYTHFGKPGYDLITVSEISELIFTMIFRCESQSSMMIFYE